MKETALKYRASEVQKYVINRLIANMKMNIEKRKSKMVACIHFKKLIMHRWMKAMIKVQEIRDQLLNKNYDEDFENKYVNLN